MTDVLISQDSRKKRESSFNVLNPDLNCAAVVLIYRQSEQITSLARSLTQ